ncbi:probable flavin-containing monooxygenase 1 isoform X2 [Carica papaya]|uniref:probable flavin-containing monooxygenase 1 isoform X2 n=1 Tax=Carica papaya TaxID=3649 RepID=UPI000B8D1046|nr:probable flavin-containing monooxygenase 1 isoform X2 [Carica papaya]
MEKQIAIIGAGLSGLLACKYVLSKGLQPIVFESRTDVGGVWIKTIQTTKLQTPKSIYQFSDFPWPSSVPEDFPDHDKVLDYIKSYAEHFDLIKHIKFNSRVVGIEYEGASGSEEIEKWSLWSGNGERFGSGGKWKVVVEHNHGVADETKIYKVDFVILCVGRFSDVPNIPEYPPGKGPETFHGKVIHSIDYTKMEYETAGKFVEGKRVAIVGFQKSALDIAMEVAAVNGKQNPCTVLYRSEQWGVPDYLPWGLPLAYLYLTRFSELLLHKPGEGLLLSLLASILSPVRWAFSKFVETHIKRKLRLEKFGMVPEHSFFNQINTCLVSTVPENFYEKVEEGSIILKKAPSFSFCKEGIMVDGETKPIETDLVIFATGFSGDKKLKDIFMSKTFQDSILGSTNAAVPLYRECIHPRIPQLAVIGYSESVSNLYTSEIRSKWLAELLGGTFKLPSIKDMEEDVAKWDKHWKRYSGKYYRRSCIAAIHIWYNDQLCKDMGWNPKRKKGFFADLFEPYGPTDYLVSS